MPIKVANTRQVLAQAYANQGAFISLHTADPGTNGGSEVTGGAPAYARKATTWTAGTGGVMNGSQVAIDVPAGTFTFVGIWSAATGGTFIDSVAIASTTLGAQGQILVTPKYTQS